MVMNSSIMQSEQLNHSHSATDGEIYQKVRSEEDSVEAWTMQLSRNKQGLLSRLLKRKYLVKALDSLLPFPALWYDFKLGSIHKWLAIHCDELFIRYVRRIHTTMDAITLGEEDVRENLDVRTLQNLHQRAPSASSIDRRYIEQQMDLPSNRSTLFPGVEDREKRNLIKRALLRLEVIIPTIKSLQKNLIYLGIGASIVETLLLDEKEPKSVYKALYSHWAAPGIIREEIREGRYVDVTLERPGAAIRFCLVQVFLAAFREFPNLGDDAPLIEVGSKKRKWDSDTPAGVVSASVSPTYKYLFLKRAQLLGFRTKKIEDGLRDAEELTAEILQPFIEDNNGEIIKRRSGTPYTNAYKQFRTQLFLVNLRQVQREFGLNPSVMFVQRDFINAFFGWTLSSRDFATTAPISVFEPATHPERVLLGQSQAEVTNSSPGSMVSPQSTTSSRYTQVMSLRVSSEPSQGTEGHWSRFSLPAFDESDSEGEGIQRRRSLATGLQDRDVWSPASMDDSDHRSFPELGFRGGSLQDERRFPELTDGEDNRRSFSAMFQDVDTLSLASTDTLGRRSFPELEFRDERMRDEHQSFTAADWPGTDILSLASTDETGRRSFPELEFQTPALVDGDDERRSFPAAEVRSTSSGDSTERRSFPVLEIPDIGARDGGRSFPVPELHGLDSSRPYGVEAQRPLAIREVANLRRRHQPFVFTEYNGMTMREKVKFDMAKHLEGREEWVMMVLKRNVPKTIRFKNIVEHMRRPDEEVGQREYFLVRRHYADHFRTRYMNNLRTT